MPPLRIMPPSIIKTAFSAKTKAQNVIKAAPRPCMGDVFKSVTSTKASKVSTWSKVKNFIMDLLRD